MNIKIAIERLTTAGLHANEVSGVTPQIIGGTSAESSSGIVTYKDSFNISQEENLWASRIMDQGQTSKEFSTASLEQAVDFVIKSYSENRS